MTPDDKRFVLSIALVAAIIFVLMIGLFAAR
jgi:hypothetical protein